MGQFIKEYHAQIGKFRVLLLYPNGTLMNPLPIAVGFFQLFFSKKAMRFNYLLSTI